MHQKVEENIKRMKADKKKIIQNNKDLIKQYSTKIHTHMNLNQIQPICFLNYDFQDFRSSFFNVFKQDIFNNELNVSKL